MKSLFETLAVLSAGAALLSGCGGANGPVNAAEVPAATEAKPSAASAPTEHTAGGATAGANAGANAGATPAAAPAAAPAPAAPASPAPAASSTSKPAAAPAANSAAKPAAGTPKKAATKKTDASGSCGAGTCG